MMTATVNIEFAKKRSEAGPRSLNFSSEVRNGYNQLPSSVKRLRISGGFQCPKNLLTTGAGRASNEGRLPAGQADPHRRDPNPRKEKAAPVEFIGSKRRKLKRRREVAGRRHFVVNEKQPPEKTAVKKWLSASGREDSYACAGRFKTRYIGC